MLVIFSLRDQANVPGKYLAKYYFLFDDEMAVHVWQFLTEQTRMPYLPPVDPHWVLIDHQPRNTEINPATVVTAGAYRRSQI